MTIKPIHLLKLFMAGVLCLLTVCVWAQHASIKVKVRTINAPLGKGIYIRSTPDSLFYYANKEVVGVSALDIKRIKAKRIGHMTRTALYPLVVSGAISGGLGLCGVGLLPIGAACMPVGALVGILANKGWPIHSDRDQFKKVMIKIEEMERLENRTRFL